MNNRPRFNIFQSSLAAELKTEVRIVLDMASVGWPETADRKEATLD